MERVPYPAASARCAAAKAGSPVSVDHAGPAVMGLIVSSRPHGAFAFRCAIRARCTAFGSWPGTMRTPMRARADGTIWLLEPSTGEASSAVTASAGSYHCAA